MSKKAAILCVDDEPIVLHSLKADLRRQFESKFLYETSSDPVEALSLIEDFIKSDIKIVLIVSDYLMPMMKGDEFLKIVKERYTGIHTIILTGQMDTEAMIKAIENGYAEVVISKPWKGSDLAETIKEVCSDCFN